MPTTSHSKQIPRSLTVTGFDLNGLSGLKTPYDSFYPYGPVTIESVDKSWVRTPGFQALRKIGAHLPDNAYSYVVVSGGVGVMSCILNVTDADGNVTFRDYKVENCFSGVFLPPPLSASSVDGKLLQRAAGNSWSVPVFIAEAGKTSVMVYNAASKLVKMLTLLRKGQFLGFVNEFAPVSKDRWLRSSRRSRARRVKRFNEDFGRDAKAASANAWLEYSYGWVPFISDVRNAVNTLMDTVEMPQRRSVTVSAQFSRSTTTSFPEETVFFEQSENLRVLGTVLYSETSTVRGVFRATVNGLDLPARFGLVNPLEVIWELLPLSFVVDWFLPIGDYLKGLTTQSSLSFAGGSYGFRYDSNLVVSSTSMVGGAISAPIRQSTNRVDVSRAPMTGLPTVSLTASFGITSVPRAISSIALLSQQISRLSR